MRPEPVPTSRNRLARPCGAAWSRAEVNARAMPGGQEIGGDCPAKASRSGRSIDLLAEGSVIMA
jgi:hypothetical protein